MKVFQNVTERLAQIIYGIWIEITHNLGGSLDNIKGNEQLAYFIDGFFYHVEWFYSTPKYLFKPMVRI